MVNPSSDLSSCRFILIAYLFWGDYSQLSDIHTEKCILYIYMYIHMGINYIISYIIIRHSLAVLSAICCSFCLVIGARKLMGNWGVFNLPNITHLKFNSSPLKSYLPKRKLQYSSNHSFSGATLVSGRVRLLFIGDGIMEFLITGILG